MEPLAASSLPALRQLARAVLGLALAHVAAAQITYVSHDRHIEGRAHVIDAGGVPTVVPFRVDAQGAAPFLETRTVQSSTPVSNAMTTASQDSTLDPARIAGAGAARGSGGSSDLNGVGFGNGDSTCRIDVTFDVGAPADYTLTGTLHTFDTAAPSVILADASGAFVAGAFSTGEGTDVLDESGQLAPGRYTLRAFANGSGGGNAWWNLSYRSEFDFELEVTPASLGSRYCTAGVHSAGSMATLVAAGSPIVADADLTLGVDGAVPGQFGLFFHGATQAATPLGAGILCVGAPLYRVSAPLTVDAAGSASHAVDFTAYPAGVGPGALVPGTTWNFQFWYRDPGDPLGSNTSDALSIAFF